MCTQTITSPSPAEIGPYWSDEQLILLLEKCMPGSSLPSNLLSDFSPYEHPPSELPGEIWYLVRSTEKKESIYGFWKPKGEPCKIYSDSTKNGWRTTLQFFEGESPNGKSTGWLMQEYSITRKESNAKELQLLCRVFLCSEHGSDNTTPPRNCETDIDALLAALPEPVIPNASEANVDSLIAALPELVSPNVSATSTQSLPSESKSDAVAVVVDGKASFSPQGSDERDCILRGDYLEINDLKDPESQSSSSQNSSCRRKLSEESFDSLLMEIMEQEEKEYPKRRRQSSSKYNFTPAARSNDVVVQSIPSRSLLHDAPITERSKGSEVTGGSVDVRVQEHTRTGGTRTTLSIIPKSVEPGGKVGSSWVKKLKICCCFIAF